MLRRDAWLKGDAWLQGVLFGVVAGVIDMSQQKKILTFIALALQADRRIGTALAVAAIDAARPANTNTSQISQLPPTPGRPHGVRFDPRTAGCRDDTPHARQPRPENSQQLGELPWEGGRAWPGLVRGRASFP